MPQQRWRLEVEASVISTKPLLAFVILYKTCTNAGVSALERWWTVVWVKKKKKKKPELWLHGVAVITKAKEKASTQK